MNSSSFMRKALPHFIAIVSFLIISIFMYRPIIFEGKVMDQNDINQGMGASKVPFFSVESGNLGVKGPAWMPV